MNIIELVAATGIWTAEYDTGIKPRHIACWALVEESGQRSIVGMIYIPACGAALEPADNEAGFTGYKKIGK